MNGPPKSEKKTCAIPAKYRDLKTIEKAKKSEAYSESACVCRQTFGDDGALAASRVFLQCQDMAERNVAHVDPSIGAEERLFREGLGGCDDVPPDLEGGIQ
jgi:hypothetical protein